MSTPPPPPAPPPATTPPPDQPPPADGPSQDDPATAADFGWRPFPTTDAAAPTSPTPPRWGRHRDWLTPGRLLLAGGAVLLFTATFLPWYVLRVPIDYDPCRNLKHTGYEQICIDQRDGHPEYDLAHYHWSGWAGSVVSWLPALIAVTIALAVLAGRLYRHQVPRLAGLIDRLALLVIAAADAIYVIAAIHMPSPGGGIPGSQVWTQGFGLYLAGACLLVATTGAILITRAIDLTDRITRQIARWQAAVR